MVNEFSEYARSPTPHLESLDLNALIREIVSFYDAPKVSIQLALTEQACLIKGDSTMLRQVLHNLLQNAQDALASALTPLIQITTAVYDNMLVLTVQDNGGGFPAEMMLHVFEPYMTTKQHGTGLGLAIVKKIIEEHKGNIKVENVLTNKANGSGAIITISIPLFIS